MLNGRAFFLAVLVLSVAIPALAQPGTYGPICGGLASINWCHQFDPGLPISAATDASGNTYVMSQAQTPPVPGPIVTKLGPDGSVLYKAQFESGTCGGSFPCPITPGPNGKLWVWNSGLYQLDLQGNQSPIVYSGVGGLGISMASDASGNVYLGGFTGPSYAIVKINADGTLAGSFSLSSYARATAIAVDAAGAVYVVGTAYPGFTATPGALQTTIPTSASGVNEGFVMKVSPALDHVVYATLLYLGQGPIGRSALEAIAVDGQGNVYTGGYSLPAPDVSAFPANPIGLPLITHWGVETPTTGTLCILKLNPQGSALVWSAGLGDGSLDALAVQPDGRVRALMYPDWYFGEFLLTISAAGDRVESENFLGSKIPSAYPFGPVAFLATAPDGSAPARMLTAVSSARIPVTFDDQAETPLLLDFKDPAPQADLSLSWTQGQPFVQSTQIVDVVATIQNDGPADAEGVLLYLWFPQFECLPGGVAICTPSGAVIPRLPAGQAISLEFKCTGDCSPIGGDVFALTSDPNLANNSASLPVSSVDGSPALIAATEELTYYRSDDPNFVGGIFGMRDPPNTASPSLTVWVPFQTFFGNVFYFDSWGDGNRDNPRTFDASNGIPLSIGLMSFHAAFPFGVDPGSLDLVALPGSAPLPQTVTLVPIAGRTGAWTIGQPAASWLTLNAVTVLDGGATVTGTANLTGLAPGYYTTTFPVTLAVSGQPDVSMDIPASLRIMATAPLISPGGVVNAASYQGGPVSSFEVIAIYGSGLGPPQLVQAFVPQAGILPSILAGASVQFQNQPARLLYVQDNVIAAILPNVYNTGPSTLTVTLGGATAASITLPTPTYGEDTPGLFTRDASGTGTLAAVNADGTLNSPQNPAQRGTMVLLYGTGLLGANASQCNTSANEFGSFLLASTSPVEAFVGGKPAYVLYSGTSPGMICAVQQINVIIPDDSQTGPAVPVQLGMPIVGYPYNPYTWYSTQPGTSIAIQ